MNETLKAVGNIGAELAEAKAEIQRQRERSRTTRAQLEQVTGLLREFAEYLPYPGQIERITAALSQQAEPVCDWPACECALDPDKCKVQSAEPAPAQDELRKRFDEIELEVAQGKHTAASVFTQMRTAAMYIRPAQTEQQPVAGGYVLLPLEPTEDMLDALHNGGHVGDDKELREFYQSLLNAAPIAQTAPQQLGPNGSADRYFFAQGFEHGKRAAAPQPEQSVPEGYVLMPKQCPSWLEDAYDECCEADGHHGAGLYLPAYDAMVAALSATPSPAMDSEQ